MLLSACLIVSFSHGLTLHRIGNILFLQNWHFHSCWKFYKIDIFIHAERIFSITLTESITNPTAWKMLFGIWRKNEIEKYKLNQWHRPLWSWYKFLQFWLEAHKFKRYHLWSQYRKVREEHSSDQPHDLLFWK